MPRDVKRFAWLWLTSGLLSFPELLLLPPVSPAATRMGITWPIEIAVGAVMIVIFFMILLPFFWLAIWRRKNWARWVLLVLFVLSVAVSIPLTLVDKHVFQPERLPLTFVTLVLAAVEAVAFYFLFTGASSRWFKLENSK